MSDEISHGQERRPRSLGLIALVVLVAAAVTWQVALREPDVEAPTPERTPNSLEVSQSPTPDPRVVTDVDVLPSGPRVLLAVDGTDLVTLSATGSDGSAAAPGAVEIDRTTMPGTGDVASLGLRAQRAVLLRGGTAYDLEMLERSFAVGEQRPATFVAGLRGATFDGPFWLVDDRNVLHLEGVSHFARPSVGSGILPVGFRPQDTTSTGLVGYLDGRVAHVEVGTSEIRYFGARGGAVLLGASADVVFWSEPACRVACGMHLTELDGSDLTAFVDDHVFPTAGVSGQRALAVPAGGGLDVVASNFSRASTVPGSQGYLAAAGVSWSGDHLLFVDKDRRVVAHLPGTGTFRLPWKMPDYRLVGGY